jgi:hypothetical protein
MHDVTAQSLRSGVTATLARLHYKALNWQFTRNFSAPTHLTAPIKLDRLIA